MSLRQKISFYFEDIETPTGRIINLIITALVLLSCAIFVIETCAIPEIIRLYLNFTNYVILLIFVFEYLLRFWCAEAKIKFLFSIFSLIDLLAIVPFLIGVIDISYLRIFRWFRILRLVRFLEGKTVKNRFSRGDSVIYARILFTLFAIIFVYSGLIYQVEHPINRAEFSTFLDAVYFAVVTMTTVGFGDVTPISAAGRLLTVLMIFTGIALIPWQVGDLIKRLVRTVNKVEMLCPNCALSFHDDDARFCKNCGTQLEEN
jgi:voltage-gated potassium channel